MDNISQPIPQQTPIQPEIPPENSNSNWLRTLAIGFGIVSIGTAIAVGGYFLGTKNSQPVVENKVVTQPSPTPIDETVNWKTYANTKYGFEVKYPTDRRISETNNYTLPVLNTDKNIIVAIQTTNSSYPRSLTSLNIFVNNDASNCSVLSNGQKITKTKNVNGVSFFVYGENAPDDAMGGMRSFNDEYHVIHNNMCYLVRSSVFWTDISFVHDATDMRQPSAQEFEEQQNWIQTQQQLNNQVFSTFKFTNQNLAVDETANWKTYTDAKLKFSIEYPEEIVILRTFSEGGLEFARKEDSKRDFREITTLNIYLRGELGSDPEKVFRENECPQPCTEKTAIASIGNAVGIKTLGPNYPHEDNYYLSNQVKTVPVVRLFLSPRLNEQSADISIFKKMISTFKFTP